MEKLDKSAREKKDIERQREDESTKRDRETKIKGIKKE